MPVETSMKQLSLFQTRLQPIRTTTTSSARLDQLLLAVHGLLLDIHGQSHLPERTELGYLISRNNLNNGRYSVEQTSIRSLGERWCGTNKACFKELILGDRSLGYFMNQQGLQAVPSPQNKKPNKAKYYRGGYTAKKYGSRDRGDIDAIQMEFPTTFRKRWGTDSENRVVRAIFSFLNQSYYHISL